VPGRTPYAAVQAFIDPLQLGLWCITRAVLDARGGYYPASTSHPLTFRDDAYARLDGAVRLSLAVEIYYRVVETPADGVDGPWRVVIVSYIYTLYDADDALLLSYHWHPEGCSPITTPHLHLGSAAVTQALLADAHLPTGIVSLPDMVRLAIRDLRVRPLRRNWSQVLDRVLALLAE
jgi:hypothetical protein